MCSRLTQHEFREQVRSEITFQMNVGDPHQITYMGGILALSVLRYMTRQALKQDLIRKVIYVYICLLYYRVGFLMHV